MSTHLPGFQSFSRFLRNFVFVKLVTSGIRVNEPVGNLGAVFDPNMNVSV